ncbi:hypothetical protein TcasGA2_TC002771 [Tribolium castaneum]|uniref:Uncharacterized protein n=1 Tax=Tribolium castaneum TaxID=7070 RepID=D6WDH5_TRICA|nr:hypothetical protein TcasGA2_TC002771 [Tribolium castaneum]
MFHWRQALRTQHYLIEPLSRLYCDGPGTGTGTVVNPDGVFSEREAAMENKYFRQKTEQDLKQLRAELIKRKQRKQKQKGQGGDSEQDGEPEKPEKGTV